MTDEQEPAADQTQVPEREIDFADRKVWVKMPSPEQLLVWKRVLNQLQAPEVKGWNGEQVMRALERARKIVDSMLLNKADIEWLDDEMLDGRIGLVETSQIITRGVEAFRDLDNREARRAADKKKARRKAPK